MSLFSVIYFFECLFPYSSFIRIGHRDILVSTFVYDYQSTPIHASLNDPVVSIQRCIFIDCKTEGEMEGGAVLIQSQISQISIRNSFFNGCSSISGGACTIIGLSSFFSHCCFNNCNSTDKGNAYVSMTVLPSFNNMALFLTVHKCHKGHDVISAMNGRQSIQHSNFSHNSAKIAAGPSFIYPNLLDCFLCQFYLSTANSLFYVKETRFPKFSFNNFIKNNVLMSVFCLDKVESCLIDGCSFVKNNGNLTKIVNISTVIIQNCVTDRMFGKDPNVNEINNEYFSSSEIPTVPINFNSYFCNEENVGTAHRLFISIRHASFFGFVVFTILGSLFLCSYKKQIRQQEQLRNLRRINRNRIETDPMNAGATFNIEPLNIEAETEPLNIEPETEPLNIEPETEDEVRHTESNDYEDVRLNQNVDN